jgi:hypothetical protein
MDAEVTPPPYFLPTHPLCLKGQKKNPKAARKERSKKKKLEGELSNHGSVHVTAVEIY